MNYKDKFQDKDKNITLYNMDCMELLKNTEDNYYDLAIVDPPYGININVSMGRRKGNKKSDYHKFEGNDASVPSGEYFKELKRVSKNQIIWGANYMIDYLEPSSCWVVWDKWISEKMSFAQCELAYTSFKSVTKIFKKVNSGKNRINIHPTAKPIKLYEWLLQNYAKEGDKILDTHLGSGSIAIACNRLKYELTACELDTEYFEASVKRYKEQTAQIQMF